MEKLSLEAMKFEFPILDEEISKRVLGGTGYTDIPPGGDTTLGPGGEDDDSHEYFNDPNNPDGDGGDDSNGEGYDPDTDPETDPEDQGDTDQDRDQNDDADDDTPHSSSSDPEENMTTEELEALWTGEYTDSVTDLIGKPYVFGDNGPDTFDCSSAVCWGIRAVNPLFGDFNANSLFNSFSKEAADPNAAGVLVFYDYKGDGVINHVATLTGDGMMIHPSSGSGAILHVSDTYNDGSLHENGIKYYREIDWEAVLK